MKTIRNIYLLKPARFRLNPKSYTKVPTTLLLYLSVLLIESPRWGYKGICLINSAPTECGVFQIAVSMNYVECKKRKNFAELQVKCHLNGPVIFLKVTSRNWSPCHAINSRNYGQKATLAVCNWRFSVAIISFLICSFRSLRCKVCCPILWVSSGPENCSRTQRDKETWLARRYLRNLTRCFHQSWLQLFIEPHVVCAVTPCCWNRTHCGCRHQPRLKWLKTLQHLSISCSLSGRRAVAPLYARETTLGDVVFKK